MVRHVEDFDDLEEISIRFRYTLDEYLKAYRLHYMELKRVKRAIMLAVTLLFLGIGLCLLFGYSFLRSLPIYASIILSGILLSEYFSAPNKSFHRDPRLKEEHTMTFSDEKIVFEVRNMTASLKWKQYFRYAESPDFYLLYYGQEAFLILPKAAFTPPQHKYFKKILTHKFKHEFKHGKARTR